MIRTLQKTTSFWFKTDKNSWGSRIYTYNYHQGFDGAIPEIIQGCSADDI